MLAAVICRWLHLQSQITVAPGSSDQLHSVDPDQPVALSTEITNPLVDRDRPLLGSFLGTAASMMDEMQQGSSAALVHSPQERLALVVLLGMTGVLAGRRVGIDPNTVRGRSIGDLLKSLSGTFTGLFGVLVAIAFVLNGLEEARTLSSRLATSLTVMILALIGPGWISHMLIVYQRNHRH